MDNFMELKVNAVAENEAFVRNTVAAFCAEADPSAEMIGVIKTAVSEAISNCIVHAYKNKGGVAVIKATLSDGAVHIEITDNGGGIADIEKAREAYFTTDAAGERAGIGFTIMEAFMDELRVENNAAGGLSVFMDKKLA